MNEPREPDRSVLLDALSRLPLADFTVLCDEICTEAVRRKTARLAAQMAARPGVPFTRLIYADSMPALMELMVAVGLLRGIRPLGDEFRTTLNVVDLEQCTGDDLSDLLLAGTRDGLADMLRRGEIR